MSVRLDSLLVLKEIATSRERAKELITCGQVFVNGQQQTKPAFKASDDDDVSIIGETLKYVSRGGLKLEKAIDSFGISLDNKKCADIGASTGGFTDCMLQNGAQEVYAVDVGHNQLASQLCKDSRVINLEGVNIRYLTEKQISEKLDFISIDVSFISLSLVLPVAKSLICDNGIIVALIKPQFEAGKANVGKKGVVKSLKTHIMVLEKIIAFVQSIGLAVNYLTYSPIKGPEGNIEYLAKLSNYSDNKVFDIKAIVSEAFNKNN